MMLLPNLLRSHQTLQNNASLITRRCMSSTTSRFNHPSSSKSTDAVADDCASGDSNSSFGGDMPQHQMHILDERTLLTQLSPLKRILCLCPVPLGRGRVSWSGGDALATTTSQQQQTINLDFQTQHSNKRSTSHNDRMRMMQQQQLLPPPKVGKYRYGERFAIGVAVSDPYLTHAVPVPLNRRNRNDYYDNDDNGTTTPTYFTAEIVPTFKGDLHNLHTSSPIFHTNLPYFRKDFLQHIGHVDIGAIVLALPMESSSRNAAAFCPMPTKLQLEEERQSEEVRECLFGLLQNYVSVGGEGSSVDEEDNGDGALDSNKRDDRVPFFGPLNVQGRINHRLSVADVLSKASDNGNWDHLVRGIHSSQVGSSGSNGGTYPSMPRGGRNFGGTTDEDINGGPAMTVSPEMHAAVALNAMLERHTSDFHNSFF